jgi:hypothetical protein
LDKLIEKAYQAFQFNSHDVLRLFFPSL